MVRIWPLFHSAIVHYYPALPNRLDIERRITESGFEIAKERQMMFRENDRDVEELFGVNNAISLAE
jgi:hypothetical protein